MTATPNAPERIAVLGTGLLGTSIAMAAARVGYAVTGWDPDIGALETAAKRSGLDAAATLEDAVRDAVVVVVCAPIPAIPDLVTACLSSAPSAVVTDVGSIKAEVIASVLERSAPTDAPRFVGGHPMGGSERSGPDHASASVVDDIVWVLTPHPGSDGPAVDRLTSFVEGIGGRPVLMQPERHDRLVAFVSHLPQVASTALMELAATEEAGEPEILLLAAGGFRDLTRLASSNPSLWSDILLANREQIAEAIDLYIERLASLRRLVVEGRGEEVEETFDRAKQARLRLAAKPQVRAGVAVVQVQVPDRPGALAHLTAVLGEGDVNIEDLQIVHSPEGGRGTVYLTVAASSAAGAGRILRAQGFDPIRLA